MSKNPFQGLKATAVSGKIPTNTDIVFQKAVMSPQGNAGALIQYRSTGRYAIVCDGITTSCPQDWAESVVFAENFKELRQALGLSQQKLADITEIPKRTIQDWEALERIPPKYVQKLVLEKLERMYAEQNNE